MSRRITSMLSALAASAILATAAAAPAEAAPAGAHQAGTSGGGACLSAASSEVQRGLRQIGPPLGRKDLHWVLSSKSRDRTPWCPPLMWAQFETSGGTGSSPVAVLLFRPGKYLGSAWKPTGFVSVTGSTPISVTVTYRWTNPGDANAFPTGGPVSSTYVGLWDSFFRIGELPPSNG